MPPPIPPKPTGSGTIPLTCPHCQQVVSVMESQVGTVASCPNCAGQFQVPQAAPNPYGNNPAGNMDYQQNPYASSPGMQNAYQGHFGNGSPQDIQAFASKKVAAGICGILLGCFGVHKFILGFNGAGAIMLSVYLACLISGMCLVFPIVGSMAMGIIGLVEGIIYLTKTDEEFYQTYAIERREWF